MEKFLEKIDKEIEEFMEDELIVRTEDFKMEEDLADLIIRNYKQPSKMEVFFTNKKTKLVNIDTSMDIAVKFLKEYYNEEYLRKFSYAMLNIAVFDNDLDLDYSYYNPSEDKIHYNLKGKIDDAIVLVHEFMHSINTKPDVYNDSNMYFCEAISFFNELLMEDFIFKNFKKYTSDVKLRAYFKKHSFYIKAIQFKIYASFLKHKLEGHKIDIEVLKETVKDLLYINEKDFGCAIVEMYEQAKQGQFNTFFDLYMDACQYVVGDIYSRYLYSLAKENKQIGIEVNDLLETTAIDKMFKYLKIDFDSIMDESDIDDEQQVSYIFKSQSIKKLEYIYKKQKRA